MLVRSKLAFGSKEKSSLGGWGAERGKGEPGLIPAKVSRGPKRGRVGGNQH